MHFIVLMQAHYSFLAISISDGRHLHFHFCNFEIFLKSQSDLKKKLLDYYLCIFFCIGSNPIFIWFVKIRFSMPDNGAMIFFLNQTGQHISNKLIFKNAQIFRQIGIDIYCLGHIYMKIDLIYIFLLQGFKSRAVPKNVALHGKSCLRNIYRVLRRR